MSNPLRKNSPSPQQATEPTFGGNNSVDWALWRLSLVLREIAKDAEPQASSQPSDNTLADGDGERVRLSAEARAKLTSRLRHSRDIMPQNTRLCGQNLKRKNKTRVIPLTGG